MEPSRDHELVVADPTPVPLAVPSVAGLAKPASVREPRIPDLRSDMTESMTAKEVEPVEPSAALMDTTDPMPQDGSVAATAVTANLGSEAHLIRPELRHASQPETNGWQPMEELIPPSCPAGPDISALVGGASADDHQDGSPQTDMVVGPPRDLVDAACACDMTTSHDMQIVVSSPELGIQGAGVLPEGDKLTEKEQVALGNIKTFCTRLLKKLAPPLLKEIEVMRGVRAGQDPFTPRRNTRSVCSSARSKSKASAAETTVLKTLGIAHDDLAMSEGALGQLRDMFDSPLQEPQLRAIAAIFGKVVPLNLEGDMEKLMVSSA